MMYGVHRIPSTKKILVIRAVDLDDVCSVALAPLVVKQVNASCL